MSLKISQSRSRVDQSLFRPAPHLRRPVAVAVGFTDITPYAGQLLLGHGQQVLQLGYARGQVLLMLPDLARGILGAPQGIRS